MKKTQSKKSKTKPFGNAKSSLSAPEVEPKQSAWGKFGSLIRRTAGHAPHSSSKAKNRKH